MVTAFQDGEDLEVKRSRNLRRRHNNMICVVLTVVYYSMAVLYYTQQGAIRKPCSGWSPQNLSDVCTEQWNAADAVYFATVTMTTVGYGDLTPTSQDGKYVTLLFLLFGVIVSCTHSKLGCPLARPRLREQLCLMASQKRKTRSQNASLPPSLPSFADALAAILR
jgi:hypothetical protein